MEQQIGKVIISGQRWNRTEATEATTEPVFTGHLYACRADLGVRCASNTDPHQMGGGEGIRTKIST